MMIGGANATFVDTNVLVYASVTQVSFHKTALNQIRTLEQNETALWISRQILREYLAVLSRPQTFTNPVSSSILTNQIRAFENRFHIAEEGPQVTAKLLDLINQISLGGKQIHDANIVATMLTHDITRLLTHNTSDFKRFEGLITIVPLA